MGTSPSRVDLFHDLLNCARQIRQVRSSISDEPRMQSSSWLLQA
jgi:hypothetical protein